MLSECSQDMINLTYLEDHIIYFSKDRYTKDGLNECELINNEPISYEQLKWLTAIQFFLLSSNNVNYCFIGYVSNSGVCSYKCKTWKI